MAVQILIGDCRQKLAELPAESVHCCVTSPPYFGLRDYGCDGQIGREPSPAEYVEELVEVFRLVRAALRPDGTLWLNLGDSYASDGGQQLTPHMGKHFRSRKRGNEVICRSKRMPAGAGNRWGGGNAQACGEIKPKDLMGMPWMVAFALRADGWYLRQDLIWAKPNPMPESVRDRCTKAHEYLFLLSKSERYFYDAKAIEETAAYADCGRPSKKKGDFVAKGEPLPGQLPFRAIRDARNRRSVWTIATQPFPGAHFATFPPALVEPCIKAGSPAGGMVLDPFGGAGTTGVVAAQLGRDATLIELNPEYAAIADARLRADLAPVAGPALAPADPGPLFAGAV